STLLYFNELVEVLCILMQAGMVALNAIPRRAIFVIKWLNLAIFQYRFTAFQQYLMPDNHCVNPADVALILGDDDNTKPMVKFVISDFKLMGKSFHVCRKFR